MIGTNFETITLLHLDEYLAAVPSKIYSHYFGTSDENKSVVKLRTTGTSAAFTKFTGLLNSGMLQARTVALGNSHVTVIRARELVDFAAQMLRYLPDFVLGTETTSCRERRQLCASSAPAQYQSAETQTPRRERSPNYSAAYSVALLWPPYRRS